MVCLFQSKVNPGSPPFLTISASKVACTGQESEPEWLKYICGLLWFLNKNINMKIINLRKHINMYTKICQVWIEGYSRIVLRKILNCTYWVIFIFSGKILIIHYSKYEEQDSEIIKGIQREKEWMRQKRIEYRKEERATNFLR